VFKNLIKADLYKLKVYNIHLMLVFASFAVGLFAVFWGQTNNATVCDCLSYLFDIRILPAGGLFAGFLAPLLISVIGTKAILSDFDLGIKTRSLPIKNAVSRGFKIIDIYKSKMLIISGMIIFFFCIESITVLLIGNMMLPFGSLDITLLLFFFMTFFVWFAFCLSMAVVILFSESEGISPLLTRLFPFLPILLPFFIINSGINILGVNTKNLNLSLVILVLILFEIILISIFSLVIVLSSYKNVKGFDFFEKIDTDSGFWRILKWI
jgi:hypothetical protein